MSLINKQQVRRFILDTAAKQRAHKFTRVSAQALDAVEAAVRRYVENEIQSHPGVGKTLVFGPTDTGGDHG